MTTNRSIFLLIFVALFFCNCSEDTPTGYDFYNSPPASFSIDLYEASFDIDLEQNRFQTSIGLAVLIAAIMPAFMPFLPYSFRRVYHPPNTRGFVHCSSRLCENRFSKEGNGPALQCTF